jgi:signal peptidase I
VGEESEETSGDTTRSTRRRRVRVVGIALIGLLSPPVALIVAGARTRWAFLQVLVLVVAVPVYRCRPEHPRFLAYAFLGLGALLVAVTVGQFVLAVRSAATTPRRSLREWMRVAATSVAVYLALMLVVIVLLVLRQTELEPFRIPSTGTVPGLIPGDQILVDKRAERQLSRGDLVVFFTPGNGEPYVKRVIGIGGDVVETYGHEVRLNGMPLAQEPSPEGCGVPLAGRERGRCVFEVLPSGRRYRVLLDEPRGETRLNTLAPDEIFVLGDNRDNSYDSRHFGAVRAEKIIGRPLVIWLSFADGRMSWSRIGLEL